MLYGNAQKQEEALDFVSLVREARSRRARAPTESLANELFILLVCESYADSIGTRGISLFQQLIQRDYAVRVRLIVQGCIGGCHDEV